MSKHKILVAGASGLVGFAAVMFRKWIRRYQELGWIPPVGV